MDVKGDSMSVANTGNRSVLCLTCAVTGGLSPRDAGPGQDRGHWSKELPKGQWTEVEEDEGGVCVGKPEGGLPGGGWSAGSALEA